MDERKLADILIRHTIGSEKFSKGLADKIVRLLNAGDADLLDQIAKRYTMIAANGFDRGPATTKRLNDLVEAIQTVNEQVYGKIADALPVELQSVAAHEVDFTGQAITSAGGSVTLGTTLPSASFLETLVTLTPIDGRLLSTWVDGLEAARLDRLEQAIRIGALNGEATDGLIKRIRGTKANNYADGILNVSRRSAQTIAITANATVQNQARNAVYEKMAGIGYVEYSAILDSRTSDICRSLSGQIFRLDGPYPSPPQHLRCRSLLLPRKNDTDAPLHQPYSEWIGKQSVKVQDSVLGTAKAKLLRDGKLSHADLYRTDGKMKSLAELKAHDATLFE